MWDDPCPASAFQEPVGKCRLSCDILRVSAFDVEGDIVNPRLQEHCWVFTNKGFERLVEY